MKPFKKLKDLINNRMALNDAYKRTFDTPDGQMVLMHLCKVNFVFSSTFVQGDPEMTALHEGQRRLVLSILRQVNVDFKQLQEMAQEIQNEN
jgi:hypothetical protein